MAERKGLVTFKGNPVTLSGHEVRVGQPAPAFTAVANDLSTKSLADYRGKVVVVSTVPSLDTAVCDRETRRFNEEAGRLGPDVAVLAISRDLPFAQKRWCAAAGIAAVATLSDFRGGTAGKALGVEIADSPLAGLLARAVFVVDKAGKVTYSQIVPEITQEPDYESVLAAARKAL